MTELTYKVGLLCTVMLATSKDWEGNHNVVLFFSLTVALAVFDSLCVIYFVLWIQSLTSKHPVHLLMSLPCKWKRKIPMLEINLSKDSWQIVRLKRCWVRCIIGFPNYPSVRHLLDSSADINISASSSPPCQHAIYKSTLLFDKLQLHNNCSVILISAQVCIDERDHKLMCSYVYGQFIQLPFDWQCGGFCVFFFYYTFGTIACIRIFLL